MENMLDILIDKRNEIEDRLDEIEEEMERLDEEAKKLEAQSELLDGMIGEFEEKEEKKAETVTIYADGVPIINTVESGNL